MLPMQSSFAAEKLSVILGWYLNPNQAALIVAKQESIFEKYGLDVELVAPSDASLGPRLVAAKQADIALDYQMQLYFYAEENMPLVRIGTFMPTPLNTVIALPESGIKTPKDFKGKKIGYSVYGIEKALLTTMLENQGLKIDDIEMVNVGFNLMSALLSKQVDAVIGVYDHVQGNELRQRNIEPVLIKITDYGVPPSEEVVIVANKATIGEKKYSIFLKALGEGASYLKDHPLETYEKFATEHQDLANDLNKRIWLQVAPLFSKNPAPLNKELYQNYGHFLFKNGIIKQEYPIGKYAVQLH